MTLAKDTGFYWPWPILEGVPLNEQWYRIRNDTELLNPIVSSTYYENTDGITGHAALAGYEFGSQSFPNQYRIVYIDSSNEFHFQCNEGTRDVPIWTTLFHLDCDDSNPVQFDANTLFNANSFYVSFIAKDGRHTFTSKQNTLSFNGDQFYLTKDSFGNPEVNLVNFTSSNSSQTPFFIPTSEQFTVETNKQVLIHRSIIVDGAIVINGDLIEV